MMDTPESSPPNRISQVSIEGFRCLQQIESLQLRPLTVLIGANGSGKSTLIRFFELLSWMLKSQNLQEFVLRHGGGDDQFFLGARKTPRIHASLCLETPSGQNEYKFDLIHLAAGDAVMVVNEAYRFSAHSYPDKAEWTVLSSIGKEAALPMQENRTARTICSLLKRCGTYQFHDTSLNASLHNRWDVTDHFRLRSDGGNLAAVLFDLLENEKPRYRLIISQIQRVLPNFRDFVLEPVAGKVLLRWVGLDSDKVFGSHLTSDGSLRLFCLITLLHMPHERLPDIMFFDEPELGLHPHALELVAGMMKSLKDNKQLFIATQSPILVNCFELKDLIIAETKNGATSLESLNRDQYQAWLDDNYLPSDIWLQKPIGRI